MMRRPRARILASVSLLSTFAFAASLSSANAQDSQVPVTVESASTYLTDDEALALDAAAVSKGLNISYEQALQNLLFLNDSGEIDRLRSSLGSENAGLSFDAKSGVVKVRTKGKGNMVPDRLIRRGKALGGARGAAQRPAVVTARLAQAGLTEERVSKAREQAQRDISVPVRKTVDASYSLAEMEAILARTYPQFSQWFPKDAMFGIRQADGVVLATVFSDAERPLNGVEQRFRTETGLPLEVEILPRPQNLDAHGGLGFGINRTDTAPFDCTSGFVGVRGTQRGFLTAGHCGPRTGSAFKLTDGGKTHTLTALSTDFYRNDGLADIRFIPFPTGLASGPYFRGNRNEALRKVSGRRTLASTNVEQLTVTPTSSSYVEGDNVCWYGANTGPVDGQQCGQVVIKYYNFNCAETFDAQEKCGTKGYFVRLDGYFICRGGDSGGPAFAWTTAFGIVGKCSGKDQGYKQDNQLYYTSLDAAYDNSHALVY